MHPDTISICRLYVSTDSCMDLHRSVYFTYLHWLLVIVVSTKVSYIYFERGLVVVPCVFSPGVDLYYPVILCRGDILKLFSMFNI